MTRVFISYSHKQQSWVGDRLVPVLRAGGAEPLFDERFRLGHDVYGEMDALQDQAEKHVLCLSDEYLNSDPCRHEMERALALDPLGAGIALPLRLNGVSVPDDLTSRLFADFTADGDDEPWRKLLDACDADLGIDTPRWLMARDQALTFLRRGQSVNLVVRAPGARWKGLLSDVMQRLPGRTPWIDLEDGATTTRPDFLNEILDGIGIGREVRESHDLVDFSRILRSEEQASVVALVHFDRIERFRDDIDLSSAFRSLITERRKLVLLVQSRDPFARLLPKGHKLSEIPISTIELA